MSNRKVAYTAICVFLCLLVSSCGKYGRLYIEEKYIDEKVNTDNDKSSFQRLSEVIENQ